MNLERIQVKRSECGFHEPVDDEFVVDPKRFWTRLFRELVCDHVEEKKMITAA